MTAHLTLTLDTTPPLSPVLEINGGAPRTGSTVVLVSATSASPDVREMKLWGDVDPTAHPSFTTTEAAAQWVLWEPELAVALPPGDGRRFLYARLRDDVLNETPVFTSWIDVDLTSPVVSLLSGPDHTRVSVLEPRALAVFSWSANRDISGYQVRVVPSTASLHTAGVALGTVHGSAGVAAETAYPAGTAMITAVHGADLAAASPGDSAKIVKVFVRDAGGVWSS